MGQVMANMIDANKIVEILNGNQDDLVSNLRALVGGSGFRRGRLVSEYPADERKNLIGRFAEIEFEDGETIVAPIARFLYDSPNNDVVFYSGEGSNWAKQVNVRILEGIPPAFNPDYSPYFALDIDGEIPGDMGWLLHKLAPIGTIVADKDGDTCEKMRDDYWDGDGYDPMYRDSADAYVKYTIKRWGK